MPLAYRLLAISRNLVELMGGRIWVESTPEVGSTFHFTVRVGLAGPDRRSGLAQFAEKLASHADKPVLVVDDNPVALRLLSRIVEQLGLTVHTAQDADSALARVQADAVSPYLACLVDWRMPGINGLETIRRLRTHFAGVGSSMPAMVLVTAYSSHEELTDAAGLVDAVLAKPVSARHVYVELARSLGVFDPAAPGQERRRNSMPSLDWSRFAGLDILLVEDVAVNQEVMIELLAGVGLKARLAADGAEALAQVASHRPDLVLMDCQMPVMDGFEATRRLRQDAACRDLPIIALTANATRDEQEQCFAAGMNAHVAKPIRMEILFEKMAECLPDRKPRPGGPAALMAAAQPDMQTMPNLPGIDVAVGLVHVGGRLPLLLRVLKLFREHQGRHFEEQFTAALASGDWKTADRLAHTLKGVARTLGATDLSDAAKELETAAAARDPERSQALFAGVAEQLRSITAGLQHL